MIDHKTKSLVFFDPADGSLVSFAVLSTDRLLEHNITPHFGVRALSGLDIRRHSAVSHQGVPCEEEDNYVATICAICSNLKALNIAL